MKKLLAFVMMMSFVQVAHADDDHSFNQVNAVGVWEGTLVHTSPPQPAQNTRMTLHSDGTVVETHEYFQPAVPGFPAAILITASQGYWTITSHNTVVITFNVDAEFGPNNAPNDGAFFLVSRVAYTATFDPTTKSLTGPFVANAYTDYASTTPVFTAGGSISYTKLAR